MQHFTRNTVEASLWCRKCNKATMHRIDGVKAGPCIPCMEKLANAPKVEGKPEPKQESLFG